MTPAVASGGCFVACGNANSVLADDLIIEPEYNSGECAICLADFVNQPGKAVTRLRCGHKFHQDEIRRWFDARIVPSCPTCRTKFPDEGLVGKSPQVQVTRQWIWKTWFPWFQR
eukprot:GEMP01012405.1.p1 GENE.GEMP01012405.1~~GEMP01012405.1.p1  ORF type:complete len:114 (+),score=10.34 GEMP01012405.1:95-436(+)